MARGWRYIWLGVLLGLEVHDQSNYTGLIIALLSVDAGRPSSVSCSMSVVSLIL